MSTYHTNDSLAKEIALAAFPGYKGRKFKVEPFNGEFTFQGNYWSGGSRNYYKVLSLANFLEVELPRQNPLRDAGPITTNIPKGICVVEHSIFCGKDHGITIHVHPENMAKLLPAGETELSREERIVLVATRSYKNSYAGETNCRFLEARRETGIDEGDYEAAKESLFTKGFLAKHGKSYRITNEGRNVIQQTSLHSLREETK